MKFKALRKNCGSEGLCWKALQLVLGLKAGGSKASAVDGLGFMSQRVLG